MATRHDTGGDVSPASRSLPGARVIWLPRLVRTGRQEAPQASLRAACATAILTRAADMAVVAVISIALLPVLLLIAASLLAAGSPVLSRQPAVGRRGREFDQILFADPRMASGVTSGWRQPVAAAAGRFLNASRLRAAPQLLNVFQGSMSLLGARPVAWHVLEDSRVPRQAVETYLSRSPGMFGPDFRALSSRAHRLAAAARREAALRGDRLQVNAAAQVAGGRTWLQPPGAGAFPSTKSDVARGGIDRRDVRS